MPKLFFFFVRVSIRIYKERGWTMLWQRNLSLTFQKRRRSQNKEKTVGGDPAVLTCTFLEPRERQHASCIDNYGWKAAVLAFAPTPMAVLSAKLE